MSLEKQRKTHREEIKLTLDGRKRVSLTKLLPDYEVSSFRAYKEGNKIILIPMAEIPAHELWLHQHPEILKEVEEGLKQEGKYYLGSFAKYVEDDESE